MSALPSKADIRQRLIVRSWHKADMVNANAQFQRELDLDITARSRHVRFTPNSGHWAAQPSQHLAVGL
jgi:hypothetical protein